MNSAHGMLNDIYQRRLRELTQLIGEGSGNDEIVAVARRLKQDITNDAALLNVAVTTIDYLIASFVPEAQWQAGVWAADVQFFQPSPATGQFRPKYDRSAKVVEIVRAAVEQGTTVVSTKEIAAKLRAEGDPASDSGLATAVGNVLARSGAWRRIRRGHYELTDRDAGDG